MYNIIQWKICRVKCLRLMFINFILIRIYTFPYLETVSHDGLVSSLSHALKKKSDPVSLIFIQTPPWFTKASMCLDFALI